MRFKLMPATSPVGVVYNQLVYVCMGCEHIFGGGVQAIPVNTTAVWPAWNWDGNIELPTLEQEIAVSIGPNLCRATLTKGIFHYHTDSTHKYSGYNGYAQPFPAWYVEKLAMQEMALSN